MKKLFFVLFLGVLPLMMKGQSTPHALGFHVGGSTIDLEYQYHYNKKNFLDLNLGVFDLSHGFYGSGIYNWNLVRWSDWTPELGVWKLYAGVGGAFGYTTYRDYDGVFAGVVGTIGFGVTLKPAPLTFAVDYRPMIALALGNHSGILTPGFWNIGLSMTYRF